MGDYITSQRKEFEEATASPVVSEGLAKPIRGTLK
jgi:hypothetical protein